jgi:hypothetical protein
MEITSPKLFCFVLMPFSSDFNDIYQFGIKGSCEDVDVYCERVDEQIYQERILDRIYNQIAKADLIIADMTGKNPNVFYEIGYAHALNKPTILLTQNSDDIPFDFKHFPLIIYNNQISIIKEELTKRLIWFKENKDATLKSFQSGLEIYVDDKNLLSEEVAHIFRHNWPDFRFTIHNNSPFTYGVGDFQISVLSKDFSSVTRSDVTTIKTPDNKYLWCTPSLGQIIE